MILSRGKVKDLRKKIRRLEKRLRQGSQKLAELKRSLESAEAVKALKAARKCFARAAAARIADAKKPAARKAKKRLNLSSERRAQLATAMKLIGAGTAFQLSMRVVERFGLLTCIAAPMNC